jgi:acyl carrier protein
VNQDHDYRSVYTYFADWVGRQDLGGVEVVKTATLSDLGLDSLALVDLVYELKRRHGLVVPLEYLEGVRTVDEVVTIVLRGTAFE